MFDSKNLPLEPRKVIKKSIGRILGYLISGGIIIALMSLTRLGTDATQIDLNQFLGWAQLAIFGLIVLGSIINIIYQYLYYKFYYYNFGEDSGEIRKGVVAQATGHVYYNRIQNIFVDQDIWDRIFGLYDVHYETAGDSSGFYSHVDGLNKENSQKLLQFLIEKAKNTPGQHQTVSPTQIPNPPIAMTANLPTTPNPPQPPAADFSKQNLPVSPKYAVAMSVSLTVIILVVLSFMGLGPLMIAFMISLPALGIFTSLVVIFLTYLFCYLYSSAWVKNFDYAFDQEKGTIMTGVFGRKTAIIYYNRVQNINVTQGFIDRLWGLNSVSIETAGSSGVTTSNGKTIAVQPPTIVGLSKEDANRLKDFLLAKTQTYAANI